MASIRDDRDDRYDASPVGWYRRAVGLLVSLNELYLLLLAFGNITDYGTNPDFVRHVPSMDTTNFGAEPGTARNDDVMWRAITNETVQEIAYVGLIAWESVGAIVLLVGAATWFRSDQGRARAWPTASLLMVIALFFGGFIVIGGD